MIASDIFAEATDVLANRDQSYVFRVMTRAVELLAPTGMFDPLVGYLDFAVSGTYFFALPRDVKSLTRININNNPSFARSRLFEFSQNTDGTVIGAEVGWSWADRGTTCIQAETGLPGQIEAWSTNDTDNGLTVTITGRDTEGRTQTETLILDDTNPTASVNTFAYVDRIIRVKTFAEVYLKIGATSIARYYPDETEPNYRVIKLSQTGVVCRMIYRRKTYKITSMADFIPMDSAMAMLQMMDAVRLFYLKEYDASAAMQAKAIETAKTEQASRTEGVDAGMQSDAVYAVNRNINTLDCIICADVYDMAALIFGPIGREKLFDAITKTLDALASRGQWDSLLGNVDLWKPDHSNTIRYLEGGATSPGSTPTGDGFFVLPRFVDTVLAVNVNGRQGAPRNEWFEFHLNGPGEEYKSDQTTWTDLQETNIINDIPIDPATRMLIPQFFAAAPNEPGDNNATIRIYGHDVNNNPIFVNDQEGILVPCINGSFVPNPAAPGCVRIARITKIETTGFVRLYGVTQVSGVWTPTTLFGYYYPDELDPVYRKIAVPIQKVARITVKYRKRRQRVTSLFDPLQLRSVLAIENMMRSVNAELTGSGLADADNYMNRALQYLKADQATRKSISGFTLQFDAGTIPTMRQDYLDS